MKSQNKKIWLRTTCWLMSGEAGRKKVDDEGGVQEFVRSCKRWVSKRGLVSLYTLGTESAITTRLWQN